VGALSRDSCCPRAVQGHSTPVVQSVIAATAQKQRGRNSGGGDGRGVSAGATSRRGPVRTGAVAALIVFTLGTTVTLGLGYLDQRVATEWDVIRLGIGPPSPWCFLLSLADWPGGARVTDLQVARNHAPDCGSFDVAEVDAQGAAGDDGCHRPPSQSKGLSKWPRATPADPDADVRSG